MKRIGAALLTLLLILFDPAALDQRTETQARDRAPPPAGGISVQARPVPLGAPLYSTPQSDPRFLGGLELTSRDTSRLHGLSDIRIDRSGRLISITDEGDVLEATLASDADGAPIGLKDARLQPLRSDGGSPIRTKQDGDAEGLAVLSDGRTLVSFERNHRILVYRSMVSTPERAPIPRAALTPNRGLEALTDYPSAGGDAYLTGTGSGVLYLCRISRSCERAGALKVADGYSLTAITSDPQGRIYLLLRSHDPLRGTRIRVVSAVGPELIEPKVVIQLAPPATVDNFEGLEFRIDEKGRRFLYVISDDNFSEQQRTLLLAFRLR